jgi:hypothetical protein
MLFRRPELLYFLFALIIPIIVHLFQLRKFKKERFSNVAFLQQIVVKSRKSSTIKKLLLLFTRLLLLAALILAFAQPFIPATGKATQTKATAIYLDNSLSMQMPGENMSLLKEAAQQLIPELKNADQTYVFTNDDQINISNDTDWQNQLLEIEYSANQLSYEAIKIKAGEFFSGKNNENQLIMISDFQKKTSDSIAIDDASFAIQLIPLRPESNENFSVEKARLSENENQKNLEILVRSSINTDQKLSLTVSNGQELVAKKTLNFDDNQMQRAQLPLTDEAYYNGMVSIKDEGLEYDNKLYFSVNPLPEIKILSINQSEDAFLKRIFREDDFDYQAVDINQLNLADLQESDFIILNGVQSISNALRDQLIKSKNKGKSICVIPGLNQSREAYNDLLKALNLPVFKAKFDVEKTITKINFKHTLLKNVFTKAVKNFDYPKVDHGFTLNAASSKVLGFLEDSAFLVGYQQAFVFSGSIAKANSNFQSSPLIVPIFYNMAIQSANNLPIYQEIGKKSTYSIKANLGNDDILRLIGDNENFIPRQQSTRDKTGIETRDFPSKAGTYSIVNQKDTLGYVSYNFTRDESRLDYLNLSNQSEFASTQSYFDYQATVNNIVELWKWLLIFALVFLIVEILILKYVK